MSSDGLFELRDRVAVVTGGNGGIGLGIAGGAVSSGLVVNEPRPWYTLHCQSGVPGLQPGSWQAFLMPAKTRRDIVDRFQKQTAVVINAPDVEGRLHATGHKVIGSTADQREAKFKPELETNARVVREARIPQQN